MQTLKKIEDTQRRTDAMAAMKAKLTDDRRKSAAATKLQKEKISAVMESVRSDASKAQKIISKALSGKISLAALTGTETKKKLPKRSKSASNLQASDTLPPVVQLEPLPPKPNVQGLEKETEKPVKPYISPYDGNYNDSG